MSVTVRFQIESPDDAKATMHLTMTIAEWKFIRESLRGVQPYAATQLARAIDEVVETAEKVFYARISDKESDPS